MVSEKTAAGLLGIPRSTLMYYRREGYLRPDLIVAVGGRGAAIEYDAAVIETVTRPRMPAPLGVFKSGVLTEHLVHDDGPQSSAGGSEAVAQVTREDAASGTLAPAGVQ